MHNLIIFFLKYKKYISKDAKNLPYCPLIIYFQSCIFVNGSNEILCYISVIWCWRHIFWFLVVLLVEIACLHINMKNNFSIWYRQNIINAFVGFSLCVKWTLIEILMQVCCSSLAALALRTEMSSYPSFRNF